MESGFKNEEQACIYAKVLETVKSETTFINEAKISGEYENIKIEDSSKWKTICYKTLPKTGF